MKDYKTLFGYAAIIMACTLFVRSFQPAHAINGPNISMGSNPIANVGGYGTIFTNTSGRDFIVTDVSCEGNTYISVSSQFVWYCRPDSPHRFTSGITVANGESLSSNSASIYLSGYYAH
ncbi:MAG: hypothetical protein VX278_17945 [Myxococcota bacterium]|nr:hypothetical protein [Myxococcota bacterium]